MESGQACLISRAHLLGGQQILVSCVGLSCHAVCALAVGLCRILITGVLQVLKGACCPGQPAVCLRHVLVHLWVCGSRGTLAS